MYKTDYAIKLGRPLVLSKEFSANKAWLYGKIFIIQRDKGAAKIDTSFNSWNDLVPAILNTTMSSSPLKNIVDPYWGGRDNVLITGQRWSQTLSRHSLLVNAVEFYFHKMASSIINVHASVYFYVNVILKLEPWVICIF